MKAITKKNRTEFINEAVKELIKSGAKEIERNALDGRRFRLQTKNNFITVRLDDSKSSVYTIFGRYDSVPNGEMNAKNNFHSGNELGLACARMEDYIFTIQQDEKY